MSDVIVLIERETHTHMNARIHHPLINFFCSIFNILFFPLFFTRYKFDYYYVNERGEENDDEKRAVYGLYSYIYLSFDSRAYTFGMHTSKRQQVICLSYVNFTSAPIWGYIDIS